MDVKQGCHYLADRAFRVTDYRNRNLRPRVKSLWHPSLFTDPLFFLQSPLSARDQKYKPRGDLLTEEVGRNEKKK